MALVTILLGALTLPDAVPDRSALAYFSGGLLSAGLLVGVLFAADILGARVARRSGVTVGEIRLNAFGSRLVLAQRSTTGWRDASPDGVSSMSVSPDVADAVRDAGGHSRGTGEAWTAAPAASGPATTPGGDAGVGALTADSKIGGARLAVMGAVGAVFTALGALAPAGHAALIGEVASWVGAFALLVMLVELLPSPRSTGGRMLAAAVARRTGSAERGRSASANAGVATGWVLIGFGVAAAFVAGFAGLWAVVFGWVMVGSSRLVQAQQRASAALEGFTVREVMGPPPPMLSAWQTVADALDEVALPSRATTFLVEGFDGSVGGVARLRDLADVPVDDRGIVRVNRVVVPIEQVATARPTDALTEAVARLALRPAAGLVLVLDEAVEGGRRAVGAVGPDEVNLVLQTSPPNGPGLGGGAPPPPETR